MGLEPAPRPGFAIDGVTYDPLIIAELGSSHGGDLVKARELADAAAEAGADCVKVQIIYAHEILHPNTGLVPLPGGAIGLYGRFKALERDIRFYADLKNHVEARGLLFLATPFGPQSLRELASLKPRVLKIASPELNHTALLRGAASCGIPTLLSTGVSRLGDIEEAVSVLGGDAASGGVRVCLLHCITSYPAPERDYNLRLLPRLSGIFGLPVGVSDHSLDPELVPLLALSQGAAAVEKHFCLSREDPGLDDPIALPPAEFARMVRGLRRAASMEGPDLAEDLARERGRDLVAAVLGDGVKRLAPSEAANYGLTNRSIHALRDIAPGETLSSENMAVLRSEKTLRPGLAPAWEEELWGRRARNAIPAGEGIRFQDIE